MPQEKGGRKIEKYEMPEDVRRAIEGLEEPIEKVVEQLLPEIEKGAYSAIIGDDASGRIPTLMMAGIIKELYVEKERKTPIVRFIAGSTGLNPQAREKKKQVVIDHIQKIMEDAQKEYGEGKALLVTDTISSGGSMSVLADGIKGNDWDADMATVGHQSYFPPLSKLSEKWGIKVVYGKKLSPSIYNPAWFDNAPHGVKKSPRDLFSHPLIDDQGTHAEKIQKNVNTSRELASEVAQRVLEHVRERYTS